MQKSKQVIGLMQGRLTNPTIGKIQEFPKAGWKDEIRSLKGTGLDLLEWTIDLDGFWENPFVSPAGRPSALDMLGENEVRVESITCIISCINEKNVVLILMKAIKNYSRE